MKKLSPEALAVLDSDVIIRGSFLSIEKPLDRKLYVEVNAALEALGGKWDRKSKAHVFGEGPADALDQVLVDGGFHDARQDLQQFFTPPKLAKMVVERADVKGRSVLEPSAGMGALAFEAVARGASSIWCVEKDPKCVRDLLSGFSNDESACVINIMEADFLATKTVGSYERVVANFPFTRQQDIDHCIKAYGLLTVGGLLVAIMSAGTKFRQNQKTRAFRDLVQTVGEIEDLPEGSFKESGTNVNTVLVVMKKR